MYIVLYILPFGLVRLRSFRLAHGLVRWNMSAGVHARGADVSFRDVTKETPDRKYDWVMWMTSCTGSVRGGFWGIWKNVSELCSCLGRRRLTFACSPRPCGRCRTWFGADGKVSIERLCLSPHVEKPFNSKVIKSFVSELRSRKCFSCFRIPMLSIYELWTFYVHFAYSCNKYSYE